MTLDLSVPLPRMGGIGGGWSGANLAWMFECILQRRDGGVSGARIRIKETVSDAEFFALLAKLIGNVLSYQGAAV